jgi:hypothetical protein
MFPELWEGGYGGAGEVVFSGTGVQLARSKGLWVWMVVMSVHKDALNSLNCALGS